MAVRAGEHYQTVDDLQGKDLGTVEGYVWVKSIQAVPGAKLHAYPDGNERSRVDQLWDDGLRAERSGEMRRIDY